MLSGWDDAEAAACVERYASVAEELALRVYTSRLIGAEPGLVLHGGGNTSVVSRALDLFGNPLDVLHIKGSGWDLASIEPEGLPAVRLADLVKLRELERLDDETMVAESRRALLDSSAPNPSIEVLLHAFLPHQFIDHSHADAILALTNQRDGELRIKNLFGDRVAWVPYVMAGFELAKRAAEIYEKFPDSEGLVLEKHGLFTFGSSARESYERHISIVDAAERHILEQLEGQRMLDARPVVATREALEIAPLVRGALAELTEDRDQPFRRVILEYRKSDELYHFAAADIGPALAAQPPITPDHVIRTKGPYLFIERPQYGSPEALGAQIRGEVERYRSDYRKYFERNQGRSAVPLTMLDPTPRVVVMPGLGIFAAGTTRAAARIAADIAEHTIRTKIWATTIGMYDGLSEGDLFDMEYWSLEQAKLAGRAARPLDGQVAVITGGAGAIGEGIARQLLEAGAHVVLLDRDETRLEQVQQRLGTDRCVGTTADVGDEISLRQGFEYACAEFGGIDIVVPNAGIAVTGRLADLEPEDFDAAVNVNLTGTFLTVRQALRTFELQGTGGNIVLISTKNVPAPGAEFGAYSASKAGAHQIARVAALEGAAIGVRANCINADAVFGTEENRSGLWAKVGPERAAARGLAESDLEEFYRKRSLLKARVNSDHVGRAVVFFASQLTPTTGASLPVDGGLPDAAPR
jgi:rhamnulose-1-phosphate aldolase/alcohol dehydrogenase